MLLILMSLDVPVCLKDYTQRLFLSIFIKVRAAPTICPPLIAAISLFDGWYGRLGHMYVDTEFDVSFQI